MRLQVRLVGIGIISKASSLISPGWGDSNSWLPEHLVDAPQTFPSVCYIQHEDSWTSYVGLLRVPKACVPRERGTRKLC